MDSIAITYSGEEAIDNCGIESLTYFPASGSNFAMGTTTVTCSATSNTGEMTSCTFDVTILKPQVDLVPSIVTCNFDNVSAINFNSNIPNTIFEWTSTCLLYTSPSPRDRG